MYSHREGTFSGIQAGKQIFERNISSLTIHDHKKDLH